jgi:hypothetical protein
MGKQKNALGVYDHSEIKVGDIVIPDGQGVALRSGGSWYPFAICAGVTPRLTLVSEGGDMLWAESLPDMPLRSIGRATPEQMAVVNPRYQSHAAAARQAEVKTAMAGLNVVYRVEWTEYERGWGCRPDGVSYSSDLDALKAHIKSYESGGRIEEYSRAGNITQCIVTQELMTEINSRSNHVLMTPRNAHEGEIGVFTPRQG